MAAYEHNTRTTRLETAPRQEQRPLRGMRLGVLALFVLGLIGFGGGIAAGPANAAPWYSVFICKQAAVGSGVTGTFSFTVSQADVTPFPFVRTVQVPVGGCKRVGIGAPDQVVITETATPGLVVKDITAGSGTITPNLSTRSVIVEANVDVVVKDDYIAVPDEAGTVTFTNGNANPCASKVTIWTKDELTATHDKVGCRVLKIKGKNAFIYQNSYYVNGTAKPCPDGTFDGTGCSFGTMPTNGFIWNNAFYVTRVNGVCPQGTTFDGANCFIKAAPPGTRAFAWGGKWGIMRPGTCPQQGAWDGAHCYVGTAPTGHLAFISGGYFYYTP